MSPFWRKREEHERLRERLSEYRDGRLSPGERQKLEEHLAACTSCPKELASLKAAAALLRQLPQVPVPRSFTLSLAQVRPQPAPLFMPWRLAAAATAFLLAVVVAGDLLFLSQAPSLEPQAPSPSPAAAPRQTAEKAVISRPSPEAPELTPTPAPMAPVGVGPSIPPEAAPPRDAGAPFAPEAGTPEIQLPEEFAAGPEKARMPEAFPPSLLQRLGDAFAPPVRWLELALLALLIALVALSTVRKKSPGAPP